MRKRWIRSECHWMDRVATFADVRDFARRNVLRDLFLGKRCAIGKLCLRHVSQNTDLQLWRLDAFQLEPLCWKQRIREYGGLSAWRLSYCIAVELAVLRGSWNLSRHLCVSGKQQALQQEMINNNFAVGLLWVIQLTKTFGIRAGPFTE